MVSLFSFVRSGSQPAAGLAISVLGFDLLVGVKSDCASCCCRNLKPHECKCPLALAAVQDIYKVSFFLTLEVKRTEYPVMKK